MAQLLTFEEHLYWNVTIDLQLLLHLISVLDFVKLTFQMTKLMIVAGRPIINEIFGEANLKIAETLQFI